MKLNSFPIVKLQLWLNSVLYHANGFLFYRYLNHKKGKVPCLSVLTAIWITIAFLPVNATAHAQQISLHVQNKPLDEVFKSIMKQSDYVFIYNSPKINQTRVSVDINHTSITNVLEECFKNIPFTYKVIKKNIMVKEKEAPISNTKVIVYQEQVRVNGLVVDSLGSPLSGVSVAMKNNSRVGTTTDLNGRYVLEVPSDAVLVFSMVGYDSQEIAVKGKSVMDVVLNYATSGLEDVVVVAFGTQKKKEVVGAITTINPSELRVPSSNLSTALAGRLAGVVAYQRSGEPGADDADFFIRGVTTFGYKQDPLILVDGVEMTSRDLSRMQVDDIANFSILKDAAATALYGARGANGVILISTKEGVEGRTSIAVRMENSISAPTSTVDLVDNITYMRMNNEAVLTRNPLGDVPYSLAKIDNTIAGANPYVYPNNDWLDMLFKDHTVNKRVNLNVTGGGKNARYYIAATYNHDNGIMNVDKRNNFNNNISLKSYQLRSNVNVNLTKSTEVGVRLYGTFDDYLGPKESGSHYYRLAIRADPVSFPAYFPANEQYQHVNHILFGNSSDVLMVNPYARLVSGYRDYNRSTMLAQFELKQDLSFITEGLKLQGLFNVSRYAYSTTRRSYNPFYYDIGSYDRFTDTFTLSDALNADSGTEYLDYSQSIPDITATTYIQGTTTYNRTFNKHGISGLLVFLMQNRFQNEGVSSTDEYTLQTSLPSRNLGVSGRMTYSFDERYFAEFNFGYNGSERFHESSRFGFFPSAGLAWQVSNEKFWESISKTITNLKFRGSYGLIGNDAIGSASDRFFYLSEVDLNNSGRGAVFGLENVYRRNGVLVSRYANEDIGWEKSYKANVGFDMGLFDKMNVIVDYWKEHRTNILMTRSSIPSTMGLASGATPRANVGQAKGSGIDFSVDYSQNIGANFWIQGRANFTYASSKFLVYEEPVYDNEPWKSRVGYPIKQKWGYIAERLFVDDAEVYNSPVQQFGETVMAGDIKYRDVNGDGRITSLDQVPIGYPETPEIVYGFGTSLGYKNFDLSVFFQGLARESFWIDIENTSPFRTGTNGGEQLKNHVLKAYADDYWSEDNPDPYALWPRLSTSLHPNTNQTSTWFMRNGAFLRLKNAELGYTLPQRITERIKLTKARFYLSGTNLWVWSGFKLWDVEMAGDGLGYPVQRVVNIGAQISF
ncbi:TonB-dependent receptor [Sphingobacterium chuzhouense]|uniref:TonB-dependent receptor n=1 Tax=Sphingobacterium chuzhouense TaxID=1742264 RepID=A0ABR7XQR4_9SPHI|nr:TonB-dependent receptor [Sphingobacterium chuzhouense]MBD1421493.1 TonB-dependent receptor [Sphingobacterium chuzhouense]